MDLREETEKKTSEAENSPVQIIKTSIYASLQESLSSEDRRNHHRLLNRCRNTDIRLSAVRHHPGPNHKHRLP